MSVPTDSEKKQMAEVSQKYLAPIMLKYGLPNDDNSRLAIIEAFQAGVKFYHNELQSVNSHLYDSDLEGVSPERASKR